jgi:hypothetical protein
MCVDVLDTRAAKRTRRPLTEQELLTALGRRDTSASNAFLRHLDEHPGLLHGVSDYLHERLSAVETILGLLRTEETAQAQLRELAPDVEIATYGTQSRDHHQSSKVIVATVEHLTRTALAPTGVTFERDPQARAVTFEPGRSWVSPRRLDGAIPELLDPVGLWEIKEYWGGKDGKASGGSKMSDAIYECQLVGTELRMYEDRGGRRIRHYFIFDGHAQWRSRPSDLGRAYDLLASGLVDELIVGREMLDDWPRVVRELAALARG